MQRFRRTACILSQAYTDQTASGIPAWYGVNFVEERSLFSFSGLSLPTDVLKDPCFHVSGVASLPSFFSPILRQSNMPLAALQLAQTMAKATPAKPVQLGSAIGPGLKVPADRGCKKSPPWLTAPSTLPGEQ